MCLNSEHKNIIKMKYYIILLFLGLSLTTFAQEVTKEGKIYEVKNEKIFLDGQDVTETLNLEQRTLIFKEAAAISEKMKLEELAKKKAEQAKLEAEKVKKAEAQAKLEAEKVKKEEEKVLKDAERAKKEEEKALKKKEDVAKKLEKENKKAIKAQKKAEKAQKKAEKAIKKKEKLQKNFEKAESSLEKGQKKYEKLKGKGKLSPEDEKKWLEKLEKLSEKVTKAKRKL